ncbi:hypothetical protein C1H76_8539 [Elsinoe australis]|uniref:Uncharacterized protein n=1 Tax=Elsinoe australis TaxID=40998 RepID=A0A4U7AMP6_9PEZI|nr:hypothetical protein C1H76_8539 [Elsinoe australis]
MIEAQARDQRILEYRQTRREAKQQEKAQQRREKHARAAERRVEQAARREQRAFDTNRFWTAWTHELSNLERRRPAQSDAESHADGVTDVPTTNDANSTTAAAEPASLRHRLRKHTQTVHSPGTLAGGIRAVVHDLDGVSEDAEVGFEEWGEELFGHVYTLFREGMDRLGTFVERGGGGVFMFTRAEL